MQQLAAAEIVQAFNAANEKQGWSARANSRASAGLELVIFSNPSTLLDLKYNAQDGRFEVKFNKTQAAFGDYIKGIAKALFYVLTTLQKAGLPFAAPPSYAGVQVIIDASDTSKVYASAKGMHLTENGTV